MPINMMGTIGAYAKTQKLKMQWDMKKQSRNVTDHKKSMDEWLESSRADTKDTTDTTNTPQMGGNSDNRLRTIQTKVDAGKKLTAGERAYLKEKDPETYSELEANEQEQRAYERKLKQCRTKEEVQRLKMSNLGSSLAKINSVKNNPAISAEKKLKIFMHEKRRCDRMEESTREFVRRGEYEKLPADRELVEAQKEELERFIQKPEEQEAPVEEKEAAAVEDTAEEAETPIEEPVKETVQEPAKEPVRKPEKDAVRTESPELRKVRRAKAKAAYAHIEHPKDPDAASSVDIKA